MKNSLLVVAKVLNIFIILCLGIFLLANINLYLVPHGDLFEYIYDGRAYFSLSLPHRMFILPLHPILIQVASFFTQFVFPFPEFRSAILINLFGMVGTAILLFIRSTQKKADFYYTAFLMIVCVHPFIWLGSLNATPEPLLTFLTLLSLILWFDYKKQHGASMVGLLASLTKTEGIIVLLLFNAISAKKLVKKRRVGFTKKAFLSGLKENRGLLFANLGTGLFYVTSIINNAGNDSQSVNTYLGEVLAKGLHLDLRFFSQLPQIFYQPQFLEHQVNAFSLLVVLLLFLFAAIFFTKKKMRFELGLITFIFGYLFIHMLFPAEDNRYFFPALIFLPYLLLQLAWKLKIQPVFVLAVAVSTAFHLVSDREVKRYIGENLDHKTQYYEIYTWLKEQKFEEGAQILLIATEPVYTYALFPGNNYTSRMEKIKKPFWTTKVVNGKYTYHFIDSFSLNSTKCYEIDCIIAQLDIEPTHIFYLPGPDYLDPSSLISAWDRKVFATTQNLKHFQSYPVVLQTKRETSSLHQLK